MANEFDVREKARELILKLSPMYGAIEQEVAESVLTAARNAGLEEAAKVAEMRASTIPNLENTQTPSLLIAVNEVRKDAASDLAREIRSLKTNKG